MVQACKGDFQIHYSSDDAYEPDFVVETHTHKFLCEPKRASEMHDPDVIAKAEAASIWCRHATIMPEKAVGNPGPICLFHMTRLPTR